MLDLKICDKRHPYKSYKRSFILNKTASFLSLSMKSYLLTSITSVIKSVYAVWHKHVTNYFCQFNAFKCQL